MSNVCRSMVQEDLKKWTFNNLRHCVSAGEPLNEEVIYNWEEGTHLVIKEGYGQTETTLLIGTFKKMSKWVKPGSMGKVAPGYDVRIVNNMGKEVPRGKQGNIGVKVKPDMPPGLFKVRKSKTQLYVVHCIHHCIISSKMFSCPPSYQTFCIFLSMKEMN